MIMLKVIHTGSKGNCYILSNNDTSIMLDCGVKNIQDKVDMESINGIILSHSHF